MSARSGSSRRRAEERLDLAAWRQLLQNASYLIVGRPALLFQQAANSPLGSPARFAADERWQDGSERRPWLRALYPPREAERSTILAALPGTMTLHVISADGWALAEAVRTALGEYRATLARWQLTSGRELARLTDDAPFLLAAVAPDLSRCLLVSTHSLSDSGLEDPFEPWYPGSRPLELHGVETGGLVRRFDGSMPCGFSDDSRFLLVATDSTEISILSAHDGEPITLFCFESRPPLEPVWGGGFAVRQLEGDGQAADASASETVSVISADGRWLAEARAGGAFRLLEATSLVEVGRWSEKPGLVTLDPGVSRQPAPGLAPSRGRTEAVSADGRLRATVSGAKIRLLDATTGEELSTLVEHSGAVTSVAFAASPPALVSAGRDGTLRRWRPAAARTPSSGAAASTPSRPASWLTYSGDGAQLVAAIDRREIVWLRADDPTSGLVLTRRVVRDGDLVGLAPGAERFARTMLRGWLVIEPFDGKAVPVGRPVPRVRLCAFSPTGERVLSVSDGGEVSLWRCELDRPPIRICREGMRGPRAAAFSPDGDLVALVDRLGNVELWETAVRRLRFRVQIGRHDARDCSFAPAGLRLAVAHGTGLSVWEPLGGNRVTQLPSTAPVTSVAFSPDGAWLAAGDEGGRVRLYRAHDHALACEAPCGSEVRCLAWHPDGVQLAVAAGSAILLFEAVTASTARPGQRAPRSSPRRPTRLHPSAGS